MKKALEFKNVNFSYDNKHDVLKNINLEIAVGEWISIVGHNGSGKSTLTKLMCALEIPKSGVIEVNGKDIAGLTPSQISDIGIVFQNPDNQFVGSTVYDDIAFGLQNIKLERKLILERISEYATLVGMEDFLNREPHTLSGGQKQRVAIASTLALHPKIIVLDEATSMLDPQGVKEVLQLVKKLRQELDLTIISITHDLDETLYSDRIVVFDQGEIVFNDDKKNVYQEVKTLQKIGLDIPFVKKLTQALEIKKDVYDIESVVDELCKLNLMK